MRYLWHDLRLHQNPALFEEIWAMLVEEWEWEPLRVHEREMLAAMPLPPPPTLVNRESAIAIVEPESTDTAHVGVEPALTPIQPSLATVTDALVVPAVTIPVTPSVAVPADSPAPSTALSPLPTLPLAQPLPRWRILWEKQRLPLLISLILLVWIGVYLWRKPTPVAAPPTPSSTASESVQPTVTQPVLPGLAQETSARTSTPFAFTNGGFDQPEHFAGWQLYLECDYRVIVDAATAHRGERYLAIQNRRPRCYSFYQDIFTHPAVGVTYRAAIWLRSSTGAVRRGRLTLWALGPARDQNELRFAVSNQTWTCLETTLTIQRPTHDQLRFEVYLDSHDGIDYEFDSALLGEGSTSLCPAPRLALADLQLVQPSGRIYPGATVGVQSLVKNEGATDMRQGSFVHYWVAERENTEPIDPNASRFVPVPPLAAGESFLTMHMDVYLPINLPADRSYFLVAHLAPTDRFADLRRDFGRASRSFTILPCSPGPLFCDVPADHWAAPEIQAWFDAGITTGCRSTAEPFLNLPFCPDGLVQRWMMVFFLLRRLEGKDYQPTNSYQGLFEDVPEDFAHNGVLWIEALTTQRVDMRSDACPPRGEHRRFCPNDPLRRIDFVRALLQLQRWDVSNMAGALFTDLETGSQEARAAEYMAQQGFLPASDIDCPGNAHERRFCPNAPLRRASAAVMMSRALGLVGTAK
jgi:hypothetical protein